LTSIALPKYSSNQDDLGIFRERKLFQIAIATKYNMANSTWRAFCVIDSGVRSEDATGGCCVEWDNDVPYRDTFRSFRNYLLSRSKCSI